MHQAYRHRNSRTQFTDYCEYLTNSLLKINCNIEPHPLTIGELKSKYVIIQESKM